jgi:His-Xaa-Ser system protein HxsD
MASPVNRSAGKPMSSPDAMELTVTVDSGVYPVEVVYRVCYQFTDRYFLWLSPAAGGALQVRIRPKDGGPLPAAVEGEFGNALIDQATRWSVAKETQDIRHRLVSTALSQALGEFHG